jgi:iron complex outermembrane receptor protein
MALLADLPAIAAAADAATTAASAKSNDEADVIVVLGTRRTDRTVANSPVPIDIIPQEAIEDQPWFDMNDVVRALVPSFQVDRFAMNDGSTFVRSPTMRGLPPDETLVLVNGKRRHRAALVSPTGGYQGVDMSMIPSVALKRLEVLRDGASAQYGSDAIAGVFNFQLKDNAEGGELRTQYGQFYEGDGKARQVSGNIGLPLTENGFISISAEWSQNDQTSRGAQTPGAYILAQKYPEQYGDIRNPSQIWGNPASDGVKTFFNAGIDIGSEAKFYAFGSYANVHYDSDFNYRQPIDVTGPDKAGNGNSTLYSQAGSVFATLYTQQIPGLYDQYGQPVFDGAGPTYNIRQLYPLGFTPRFYGHIVDASLASGFKGEHGPFAWDLSANYGQNEIAYSMKNSINPSMGADSPTDFYLGTLMERETDLNADFTYTVDAGLASPLVFGVGAEHRRDAYEITPGDPASYAVGLYGYQRVQNADGTQFWNAAQGIGSNGFMGFPDTAAIDLARQSWGVYGQVEADVIQGLTFDAALRHEDFSDFGGTTNWKVAALYKPVSWISARAAYSTGFRAPTVGQLYQTQITYSWVGQSPVEAAIYPVSHTAAQAFGALPLKPEQSENLSAGLVLTPQRGLTFTLDYYLIDIRDRLSLTGYMDMTNNTLGMSAEQKRKILIDLGLPNAQTLARLRYFTNAYATRTEGLDLVGTYRLDTGIGRFTTTLAANYNKSQVTSVTPLMVLGSPYNVVDPTVVGNTTQGTPKWRFYMTEVYENGKFSLTVHPNFFAGWTVFDVPANGGTRSFPGDFTLDISASYQLNDWVQLAIGASNLFDRYPAKDLKAEDGGLNYYTFTGGLNNGRVYPENAPYGYNGGFWYARANFKF